MLVGCNSGNLKSEQASLGDTQIKEEAQFSENTAESESNETTSNSSDTSNKEVENKINSLSMEKRMMRLLADVNQYTWGSDNFNESKEQFITSLFYMHGQSEDIKKYINETYLYEIPFSYDFTEITDLSSDGGYIYKYNKDAYEFVYNRVFNENKSVEKDIEVSPYDPPLIDIILVSYNEIDLNKYEVIGAYDGTGRIKIVIDYNNDGIIINSIERYEEIGSIGKFIIEETKEMPESDFTVMEIKNPEYTNELESNLTTYIFTISGKYNVIGVFIKKSLDSEEEVYDLDWEGENVVLKYKTMFPTDFSEEVLLIRSAGGTEYKMQLNDAVDRGLYYFEE
jgi:hypothetical protein